MIVLAHGADPVPSRVCPVCVPCVSRVRPVVRRVCLFGVRCVTRVVVSTLSHARGPDLLQPAGGCEGERKCDGCSGEIDGFVSKGEEPFDVESV